MSSIFRGSSEDPRDQISFKNLRKIFEIKTHSKIIGRSLRSKVIQGTPDVFHDRRSSKGFRKIFEIKQHSRSFRKSRSKIIQGPRSNIFQVFKDQSRTIGKSSVSSIFQGSSEDPRDQISFKNLRKIFEIKTHSKIIGRSLRSKLIQGTPDVLHDRRSFKDPGKYFEVKDSSKIFENSSI